MNDLYALFLYYCYYNLSSHITVCVCMCVCVCVCVFVIRLPLQLSINMHIAVKFYEKQCNHKESLFRR